MECWKLTVYMGKERKLLSACRREQNRQQKNRHKKWNNMSYKNAARCNNSGRHFYMVYTAMLLLLLERDTIENRHLSVLGILKFNFLAFFFPFHKFSSGSKQHVAGRVDCGFKGILYNADNKADCNDLHGNVAADVKQRTCHWY